MKQTVISLIGVICGIIWCVISVVNAFSERAPQSAWAVMSLCALISTLCMLYNFYHLRKKEHNRPDDE